MKPLKIGNVNIDRPLALAPMAGVTDQPFRLLCKEQGAGLVCTEMVSAKAILYKNKNTGALMEIDRRERPAALQLFGCEPEVMAEAARQIEERNFDILDINMGCPAPKVVKNGDGSNLLLHLDLLEKIVGAIRENTDKPITFKIRKGWDENSVVAVETAQIIERAGGDAITIHGRTRKEFYSGKADWDIIKKVKEISGIDVLEVSHMSRKIIKQGTEEIPVEYFYTEITASDVDKWNAIEFLMKKLNIDVQEVMTIGDNMNDKKMIEHAGLGVAMKGSTPEVIRVAKYVTDTNDNAGVAQVLEEYAL